MKSTKSQYRELRKRQIILILMGIVGIFAWLYISNLYEWPLYVILLIIIVTGALLYVSVKNVQFPILCTNCEKDITNVYNDGELQSYEVKYCPYCGINLIEEHNKSVKQTD